MQQLWLWRLDGIYVSACPSRLPENDGEFPHRDEPDLHLASLVASQIEHFGQQRHKGHSNYVTGFDIFENHVVGVLTEVKTYVNTTGPDKID